MSSSLSSSLASAGVGSGSGGSGIYERVGVIEHNLSEGSAWHSHLTERLAGTLGTQVTHAVTQALKTHLDRVVSDQVGSDLELCTIILTN